MTSSTNFYVKNQVKYLKFKMFEQFDNLEHAFSTRIGGISPSPFNSLNLGFNTKDDINNVYENYEQFLKPLDISFDNLVFSNQVHDDKLLVVDKSYKYKNSLTSIKGYDALATSEPEVALVTFYADCVPVLFFDPIKKVICSIHSGWKGTLKEISKKSIHYIKKYFRSDPKNLKVVVGPSIGSCCFEVDDKVYTKFSQTLDYSMKHCYTTDKNTWKINLQAIIFEGLQQEGIDINNISLSNICTKCNNDIFFSHRGDNGNTGRLISLMMLKGSKNVTEENF